MATITEAPTQVTHLPHGSLHMAPQASMRPLTFSTFVTENIPALLQEKPVDPIRLAVISSNIASLCDQQLSRMAESLSTPLHVRQVALLDAVLLRNACAILEIKEPQALNETIEKLSKNLGMAPSLSYGLLVRSNPAYDRRTLNTGESSKKEAAHYDTLDTMEGAFGNACNSMIAAISALERDGRESDFNAVKKNLDEACGSLNQALAMYLTQDIGRKTEVNALFQGLLTHLAGHYYVTPLHISSLSPIAIRVLLYGHDVDLKEDRARQLQNHSHVDSDNLKKCLHMAAAGLTLSAISGKIPNLPGKIREQMSCLNGHYSKLLELQMPHGDKQPAPGKLGKKLIGHPCHSNNA